MANGLTEQQQALVSLVDDQFKAAAQSTPGTPYVSWAAVPIALAIVRAVEAATLELTDKVAALEAVNAQLEARIAALEALSNG